MSRLNPYVAWMFQQFGTLDATSAKIVGNLERISKLVTEAAYLGGVSLSDQLRKIAPTISVPSDLSDSVSATLIDAFITAIEIGIAGSCEPQRAKFLAEAIKYEIHGTVFSDVPSQKRPDAGHAVTREGLPAISAAVHDLCQRKTGAKMAASAFAPLDDFVQSVARAIVRSILFDEPRQPQALPVFEDVPRVVES
jgi:hypothetical protein